MASLPRPLHFRPMVHILKRIVFRLSFEPTSMAIFFKFPFDDVIRRLYDVIEAEFYEKFFIGSKCSLSHIELICQRDHVSEMNLKACFRQKSGLQ